jgi:hypothetical protein
VERCEVGGYGTPQSFGQKLEIMNPGTHLNRNYNHAQHRTRIIGDRN